MSQSAIMDPVDAPAAEASPGLAVEADPKRTPSRRELLGELITTVVFLACAVGLAVIGPSHVSQPALILGLAICFALATSVEFPIETAVVVPSQLFLYPLLLLGPPAITPLIVFGALAVRSVITSLARGRPLRRVAFAGGDALYSLAPAIVLVAAGSPGPRAAVWVFVVALLAQLTLDATASAFYERLRSKGESRFPFRLYGVVWGVDALLTPIGILAAIAGLTEVGAPFLLLALVALLWLVGLERGARMKEADLQIETVRRERSRLRSAVNRIGEAFASNLDLDALLLITTRAAREAVDADAARASSTTGLGRKLVRRVTIHEDDAIVPILSSVERRAVEGQGLAHAIVSGVYAMGMPIGDIEAGGVVALSRRSHEFTAEERESFRYLCEQASVAARNVARHANLHRQALTDDLTGLANHRRFQELVAEGHERFLEIGAPVGLVLLDIDDFKQVNDSFGHQVGDAVLRGVAAALRETCRTTDEPARYGGEELAVVVADADLHECSRLAERMRRAIEDVEVVATGGERITVTASFGVAVMSEHVKDPAGLIAAADSALYRAKYQGKNCVRLADDGPLPTTPPSSTIR